MYMLTGNRKDVWLWDFLMGGEHVGRTGRSPRTKDESNSQRKGSRSKVETPIYTRMYTRQEMKEHKMAAQTPPTGPAQNCSPTSNPAGRGEGPIPRRRSATMNGEASVPSLSRRPSTVDKSDC